MGQHSKPDPELGQGVPPPNNADSRPEVPPPTGTHRNDGAPPADQDDPQGNGRGKR